MHSWSFACGSVISIKTTSRGRARRTGRILTSTTIVHRPYKYVYSYIRCVEMSLVLVQPLHYGSSSQEWMKKWMDENVWWINEEDVLFHSRESLKLSIYAILAAFLPPPFPPKRLESDKNDELAVSGDKSDKHSPGSDEDMSIGYHVNITQLALTTR